MANLVLQVDIKKYYDHTANNFWREYVRSDTMYIHSKMIAQEYAGLHNADYHCIGRNVIGDQFAPTFQRYGFYDIFANTDYDKIFYLDCDCIIDLKQCPNIFEYDSFSAVLNYDASSEDPAEAYKQDYAAHGWDSSYKPYVNCGVMLLTRDFYEATKDHWYEEALYWQTNSHHGTHDQSSTNCLLYKYYPTEKINILSDDWGTWYKSGSKYIEHYAGYRQQEYYDIKRYEDIKGYL